MNFFETCHGHCGYPQGSPQRVSKIWDDFHFHDFMGSPLWSLELDLWIIHWKNPKGGPHEIMKMKILPDLWYLLWWTLSVPTLSMTSFKINHYWKGWNAPKSVYRLKSRYLLFFWDAKISYRLWRFHFNFSWFFWACLLKNGLLKIDTGRYFFLLSQKREM